MKNARHAVVLFVLAASLAACFQSTSPPTASKSASFLFKFDYKAVSEFRISKVDSLKDDRWNARFGNDGTWQVLAWSEAPALFDKQANGAFLEHLLDSLRTLQITGLAPDGELQSFGLNPPAFILQWNADGTEFEVWFGHQSKEGDTFCVIRKQGHGKGSEQVLRVRGSTQRLLSLITSFQFLRFPRWSTLGTDDIDEIEFFDQTLEKPVFYAQRHNDAWADRKLRVIKRIDVTSFLNSLNEIPINKYIDIPRDRETLVLALTSNPLYTLIVRNRNGTPFQFKILRHKPQERQAASAVFASLSARPGAVFEVPLRTLDLFKKGLRR